MPFAFIPGDKTVPKPKDPEPGDRGAGADATGGSSRSASPSSTATASSCPTSRCTPTSARTRSLHLDQSSVALWVENQGVVGAAEEVDLDDIRNARPQRVAFADRQDAGRSARSSSPRTDGVERPWLFPQLVDDLPAMARRVRHDRPETSTKGYLLLAQAAARAAEKVFGSIVRYPGSDRAAAHADHPALRLRGLAPTRSASSPARS